MSLVPLPDARRRVLDSVEVLGHERVPLVRARGAVLAQTVTAREDIPPFPNTAMDGYAIRSEDVAGATEDSPIRLDVAETIAAGSVATRPLRAGEAMRIMTGAPIPEGADSVIMVELTRSGDDSTVECLAAVPAGNHIRPAGDDVPDGAVIFEPGTLLGPAHIGMLATLGYPEVDTVRRPRVGVFSTGDELVTDSRPLGPGQIRDSNRFQLLALVEEAGLVPVDLGCLPDDEERIERALRGAAPDCDALVTSGGVSMGEFDFVKTILQRLGEMNWMQIAIKPAKPFAFGRILGTPIFGLPGNPVSSAVSFELLARPALLKMAGLSVIDRPRVWALAAEPLRRGPDGKTHFQRVVTSSGSDGALRVRSAGGQGSHQLSGLAGADGLAVIPDGDGIERGERLEVILI